MAIALSTHGINCSGYLWPKTSKSRSSVHSPVSWQHGAMRMGSFDADTMVVVALYIQLGMLATCRRRVGDVSICRKFWLDMCVVSDTR